MDVCTARGPQGPARLSPATEPQLGAPDAAAAEAAVGSPEAGAGVFHGQGCETRINLPCAAKHLAQLGRAHGGYPGAALALGKATVAVGDELSGRLGARGHGGCSHTQWTSARLTLARAPGREDCRRA